jgi:hypothetical protein
MRAINKDSDYTKLHRREYVAEFSTSFILFLLEDNLKSLEDSMFDPKPNGLILERSERPIK